MNNIMDVWECDLVDVQWLSKYKDGFKYMLNVIDVFSKYLNFVPIKSKTGPLSRQRFNQSLMTKNSLTPYAGGRSGCRRIGENNF